ncbi:MAG: peptidoglycan DD-metalloendopeptidase family protein, partial [Oscillospiraceae bacterium]|nr:peptidoglycan DD-metalloendopeptidase family protein [Oscillospiraceae bacterium]
NASKTYDILLGSGLLPILGQKAAELGRAKKVCIVSETNASNENIVPTYTLTAAEQEDITDVETLTNRMITASGGTLEEAAGFYLDGRFIGAVENGDKLLDYLVNVLARSETDAEDETVSFIKSMRLTEGLYPTSQVMPLHKLVEKISGDQHVKNVYVNEPDDTPTGVASKNNITYSEMKALNPDIEKVSFFQVGNEVLISRPESYLATKVTRTEVYEEDIAFGTDSIPDDRYPQGYTVVVSAGIPGKQTVTANVTYIDGIEESRLVTKTIVTKEPVNKVVRVGTMTPQQYVAGLDQSGSGFIWPVDWGYFNGSLGSYWGHTGMYIAGNYGAPVRASRSGTVVRSAWYGPYGMHVIIDHGNGVTTLYAHMSEKYAVVGQYVVQGEMIGKVGRTGNVTGPHLHFEVRINGAYQDPIRYIGTYKKTR